MRTKIQENYRPGYDSLGEAIVIQAGKDYLESKKIIWEAGSCPTKQSRLAEARLAEVTSFFKSKWYRVLTDVCPDRLVARLDEDFERWKTDRLMNKIK